jgi:ubiquinone/menaquinone biosynthesis C-methylase UbiE
MTSELVLACVGCRNPIGAFERDASDYACRSCGRSYQVADGVLIFGEVDASAPLFSDMRSSFAATISEGELARVARRLGFLVDRLGTRQQTRARLLLDVGCGYGDIAMTYAVHFDLVVGVNTERSELRAAKEEFEANSIKNAVLVQASAQRLPFAPQQFDLVTCIQVLEHVGDPKDAIREIAEMAGPGGLLFLSVPNRFTLRPEPHTRLRGIGFLPKRLARIYARARGRNSEYGAVNMLSARQLSLWLRAQDGWGHEFVRSGFHTSRAARIAERSWRIPVLAFLARTFIGDIEIVAWRKSVPATDRVNRPRCPGQHS